ncbi:NAD(P)H-dependent flavin oxidoreductase [Clostridium oryzae]|uniref:Probable nitronate monooxygenase n=1 Tax=Clostridium oryzae TaxID=1450648 RepID=A0A1V4IIJ5_9CLOT|nr:nitronate monooxygenase [Clostridium oryzae]OPJ59515.1 nitronate monooxygenase [Clostridium oryzae]
MEINNIKIGDKETRVPIIQGGMGVGVSLSGLASAVAREGGIGIISAAQIGFKEEDFERNPNEANIRAMKKEIIKAKEQANGGIIGVNIMVAMDLYDEYVEASIESGADLIISGAGLPMKLPGLVKGSDIKIAPIVSSKKAANVILKMWDRHYGRTADLVVIEGPKAGGHLGFSKDDLEKDIAVDEIIPQVKEVVATYEEKYNKKIYVIVAGGVYDGKDINRVMSLGADGVQMATRFVATEECDAHINFKKAYIDSKKDDIVIVSSPVGMPGRAIRNPFVKRTLEGRIPVKKCYRCISKCEPATTPYCITKALINSVNGDVDNGLIFCGENAYRVNEMTTVKQLIGQLINEMK